MSSTSTIHTYMAAPPPTLWQAILIVCLSPMAWLFAIDATLTFPLRFWEKTASFAELVSPITWMLTATALVATPTGLILNHRVRTAAQTLADPIGLLIRWELAVTSVLNGLMHTSFSLNLDRNRSQNNRRAIRIQSDASLSAALLIAVSTRPGDADALRKAIVEHRARIADDHAHHEYARTIQQTALAEAIRTLIRSRTSPADLLASCQQAADDITEADQLIHQLETASLVDDLHQVISHPILRRAAQNRLVLASRMPDTIEADEAMDFVQFCHRADAALQC